jgi:UPF0716 protein FxsA
MFLIVLGLLLVLPIVEIALIVEVGQATNWLVVIGLTILTAVIGAAIIRRQGMKAATEYRAAVAAGQVPVQAAGDGAALLVAAPFLMTPGFVTDAFGFALLVPPIRRAVAREVLKRVKKKIDRGDITVIRR